jgi:hypothetical protein
LTKATQLLHYINFQPVNEALGDKSMVECATYADWVTTRPMNGVKGVFQFNLHTVRNPLFDAGKGLRDYPEFQLVHDNVEIVIPDLIHWLEKTSTKYDDDDGPDDDDDDCPDDDVLLKQKVSYY